MDDGSRKPEDHNSGFRESQLCSPKTRIFLFGNWRTRAYGAGDVRSGAAQSRLGSIGERYGSSGQPGHITRCVGQGVEGRIRERGAHAHRNTAVAKTPARYASEGAGSSFESPALMTFPVGVVWSSGTMTILLGRLYEARCAAA